MRICANINCKKEIPEGEQVCLWENIDNKLCFKFICQECSNILEQEQRATEIKM